MSVIPKLVILVVYKDPDSSVWRGFCSPYDVTCEADTENKVTEKLEKLVELYEEGLKEYGYPKNLAVKELSDPRDQEVLDMVLEEVSEKIKQQMKRRFIQYQRSSRKSRFRANNASGFYYQPQLA